MWILILTLFAPGTNAGGAIKSIEFTTEKNCVVAGNEWIRNRPDGWAQHSSICVKK